MAAKYGKTWWGGQWLEAFDRIDYSNRLPRGRRYAGNGSVRSIAALMSPAAGLKQMCREAEEHLTK